MSAKTAFHYDQDKAAPSYTTHTVYDTSRAVEMLADPSLRTNSQVGRNDRRRFADIMDFMRRAVSERMA
jgi:hypothetical protein